MLCLDLPPLALPCVFFLIFYGYVLVVLTVPWAEALGPPSATYVRGLGTNI